MSNTERHHPDPVATPAVEEWDGELDYNAAPRPWKVEHDGIRDALGRLILEPTLVSVTRGFVSGNYNNMDLVVESVNQDIHSDSLQLLQDDILTWADDTFPNRTPQSGFIKLFEEIGEVLTDPRDELEWADVFIMLLDMAKHFGISGHDLAKAIHEKMEINRGRTWATNDIGVMRHFDAPISPVTRGRVTLHGGAHAGIRMVDLVEDSDGNSVYPETLSYDNENGVVFVYVRVSGSDYNLERVIE